MPLLETLATVRGGERVSRADLERLRALELYREIPGLSETWFAFHPLFREILGDELARTTEADAVAALHRQIAAWFATAGLTRDAVHHLVEADDIPAAAALIESRLSEAFAREDWQAVASWLRLIPTETVLERPELLLASAWVAYLSGRDARIAEVEAAMRDPSVRDRVTGAQRAEMALLADWPEADHDAWVRTAEEAIARIPASKRYQHGYAHLMLGMALTTVGREDEALARLTAFTDRESARIDAASIRGYFGRVIVLWQAGRLPAANRRPPISCSSPRRTVCPSLPAGARPFSGPSPTSGATSPGHAPLRGGRRGRGAAPFHLRARRLLRPDPGVSGPGDAR